MLKKILKVTGKAALVLAEVAIEMSVNESEDKQLDQLSDGLGNYIADGESYTHQEISDKKSRGELYDTYL